MKEKTWKLFSSTEDDYIEYARCVEKLKEAVLDREEIELRTLKCNTCCFSGRCSVVGESLFLGARTC